MFHTLAARASGELCLKYIFSLGAFARSPLLTRYIYIYIYTCIYPHMPVLKDKCQNLALLGFQDFLKRKLINIFWVICYSEA